MYERGLCCDQRGSFRMDEVCGGFCCVSCAPTSAPTSAPSTSPTAPTAAPSHSPSLSPTVSPTTVAVFGCFYLDSGLQGAGIIAVRRDTGYAALLEALLQTIGACADLDLIDASDASMFWNETGLPAESPLIPLAATCGETSGRTALAALLDHIDVRHASSLEGASDIGCYPATELLLARECAGTAELLNDAVDRFSDTGYCPYMTMMPTQSPTRLPTVQPSSPTAAPSTSPTASPSVAAGSFYCISASEPASAYWWIGVERACTSQALRL